MSVERIRAAAEDLRAALAGYDPESMRQVVRELPILGEALAEVSTGLRAVADRSENEWPAGSALSESLRSMANDVRNAAGTAGAAENTAHTEHEADIERHDAPRGGRSAESRWDVTRPDEGTPVPAGSGRHRAPDEGEEQPTVPPPPEPPTPKPPAEDKHGGYNPDQPRGADGKWIKVGDALGVADEDICWGSDQVKGTGPVPTNLGLMDYDAHKGEDGWGDGGQYVEVATPKPGDTSPTAWPNLSPDEADQAAANLEELADRAERGEKPNRPSKWAKAAQQLRHLMNNERSYIKPGERVSLYDDETLPLTYQDLMGLLAQADPKAGDGTTPYRRVTYTRAAGVGGYDVGGVWAELLPDGRIGVTSIEGDGPSSTPDDEFWQAYTAHHTPSSARELATKLRVFARAARKRPATT